MSRASASVPFAGCYHDWMVRKTALLVVVLGLALLAAGCVTRRVIDRSVLAHPTMTSEQITNGVDAHVRAVSEGASGLGAGTVCGCE